MLFGVTQQISRILEFFESIYWIVCLKVREPDLKLLVSLNGDICWESSFANEWSL